MDTGLSSDSLETYQKNSYGSYLNPFGSSKISDDVGLQQRLMEGRDGSCQDGAEIFLRRIFNKLFQQVNELQPDELDNEFTYQSTITYRDYLEMMKNNRDEGNSCAQLINMENILSKVMSTAVVRRPMHTSLFGNLLFSPSTLSFSHGSSLFTTPTALHIHLLLVLLMVGLIAWVFNSILKVKLWKTLPLSMLIVGFVEFCMHKNELNLRHRLNSERCRNPSMVARIASLVNYDYDSCDSDTSHAARSAQNIAFHGVEYLSELFLQPIVHLGDKLGKALQSYLNAFTGLNYIIAPIFPTLAILAFFFIGLPMLLYVFMRTSSPGLAPNRSNPKAIKSPKKSKNHHRNNAIK